MVPGTTFIRVSGTTNLQLKKQIFIKGDAPLIQMTNTSLTVSIAEVNKGFSATAVQLLIQNVPTNVISLFDTTARVS